MSTLRQRMTNDLQLGGLSERTQEAYLRAVRQLADYYHQPPDLLSEAQVREYFLYLRNEKRFAPPSLIIAYSGIKFFYTIPLKLASFSGQIRRFSCFAPIVAEKTRLKFR